MPVNATGGLPLAIALVLASSGACHADVGATISRCAESTSKDSRILCLEDALRASADTDGVVAGVDGGANAPSASATAERPTPARKAAEQPRISELGAEQVKERSQTEPKEAPVRARVVEFDFVGYRRLLVRLENGQVWRQIDGDRTNVDRKLRDEESFEVELWGTTLGGYRMRIAPLGRTIRVERLK